MGSTLHTLTALFKPSTEHENGRVSEQIWTAVKRIITISTRARTAAVYQIATHFSDLIIPSSCLQFKIDKELYKYGASCDSALHSTASRRKEWSGGRRGSYPLKTEDEYNARPYQAA